MTKKTVKAAKVPAVKAKVVAPEVSKKPKAKRKIHACKRPIGYLVSTKPGETAGTLYMGTHGKKRALEQINYYRAYGYQFAYGREVRILEKIEA